MHFVLWRMQDTLFLCVFAPFVTLNNPPRICVYPHFFIVKEASLDSVATSMQGACKNIVCMSFLSCGFKVSACTGFSESSLACYCTCRFNEYLALHRPSSTCGGLLEMYRGMNIAKGFSAFETFFSECYGFFGVLKVLMGDLQNSRACSHCRSISRLFLLVIFHGGAQTDRPSS